jgi:hypothetical protein
MVCTFFVITRSFFCNRYNFFNYDRYSDHPQETCYQSRSASVFYRFHPPYHMPENRKWSTKIKKFSTKFISTKLLNFLVFL